MLTMLNVPTNTFDGALLLDTISATKLAAIPMMAIKDTICSILTVLKVPPRAPASGPAILKNRWGGVRGGKVEKSRSVMLGRHPDSLNERGGRWIVPGETDKRQQENREGVF